MIEGYGTSEVARWCGVTKAAVSNWMKRHDDCPKPAVSIITEKTCTYGWTAGQKQEWLDWKCRRLERDRERLDAEIGRTEKTLRELRAHRDSLEL